MPDQKAGRSNGGVTYISELASALYRTNPTGAVVTVCDSREDVVPSTTNDIPKILLRFIFIATIICNEFVLWQVIFLFFFWFAFFGLDRSSPP